MSDESMPDLGYPTPPHGRIPAFQTYEEEAVFWDTHGITDYLEDLVPVEARLVSPGLAIRVAPPDRAALARLARACGIGSATLVRLWVEERLQQEAEAEGAPRRPSPCLSQTNRDNSARTRTRRARVVHSKPSAALLPPSGGQPRRPEGGTVAGSARMPRCQRLKAAS